LNDLKVPAFALKPKFHWELSNNSRLFSATAIQGRFSNCHSSPPGRNAWIGSQWILNRKGNAVTAVRFLVQETASSSQFSCGQSPLLSLFFLSEFYFRFCHFVSPSHRFQMRVAILEMTHQCDFDSSVS